MSASGKGPGRKTRLCQFYEAGNCRRGAECGYAHGTEELQGTDACTKGKGKGKARGGALLAAVDMAGDARGQGDADRAQALSAIGNGKGDTAARGSRRQCTYFQQGRCRKGASCDFSHERVDQPSQDGRDSAVGPATAASRQKVRLCSYFERGTCRQGSDCTFAHGAAELEAPAWAAAGGSAGGGRGKTRLCQFFAEGTCRRGSQCSFAHGAEELVGGAAAGPTGLGLASASGGAFLPGLRDTAPHRVSAWLRRLGEAGDPDTQAVSLHASLGLLPSVLRNLSLSDFEQLISAMHAASQTALRQDLAEAVLEGLAWPMMQPLLQKYVPEVQRAEHLDRLLELLTDILSVGPQNGMLLEAPSAKAALESALSRCGSERSRGLAERLELVRTQSGDALHRVVVGREREAAAAAAAALPDPADVDMLPDITELLRGPGELPANRMAAWSEEEADLYRQTHYLLCLEELLAPLREAIVCFLDASGSQLPPGARAPNRSAGPSGYFAYPNTHVVEFSLSATGQPTVRLRFGRPSRPLDFSTGDHLIFGSLLVLFMLDDNGQPMNDSGIYATVEEFDLRKVVEDRTVGVCFLNAEDWQRFNVRRRYVMVESPGYFHAVRPILEWLRSRTSIEGLPLRSDILSGERSGNVAYLRGSQVNLSCLYKRDLPKREAWRQRDPLAPWPDEEELELDASQQKALRHILTCSVPLVQGPPGTGKSYIGVKAVQLIRQALDCKGYQEPIVLICLTNHALDQFLEDLLDLFPHRLARFGGRSKSEDPRLAECQVNKHLRSTRDEFEERTNLEDRLRKVVAELDHHRWLLTNPARQVLMLLAVMPVEALSGMLEALGLDVADAGLFLPVVARPEGQGGARGRRGRAAQVQPPDPVRFMSQVLTAWVDGRTLQDACAEASSRIPPDPSRQGHPSPAVANRFSALSTEEPDVDNGDASWGWMLSRVDRLVGPTPSGAAELAGGRIGDWPDDSASEDSDVGGEELLEDLNAEDIQELLDDRTEGGTSFGKARGAGRQRRRAAWGGNDALSKALRDRADCFRRMQQWEAEAENASQPRHGTAQQHSEEAAKLRWRWREARRALLRETARAVQRGLRHEFEDVAWDELGQRVPKGLDWQQPAAERSKAVEEVADFTTASASALFRKGFANARRMAEVLGQMRKRAQLRVCAQAAVVGMTSTFAALNRDLLQRMQPRVVVVEEAGELLECQLMACLASPRLEHVVLIGDHQQLRPKVNTFDLCRHKRFDISLFERLVSQGCERAELTTQLRMRPDICDLVRFFYARIEDHTRVTAYPQIQGVADCVHWISHDTPESGIGQATHRSKSNVYEAQFACRLAQHLVFNGINKARITLLTPYIGQKREFKKHLPRELMTSPLGGKGCGKGADGEANPVSLGVRVVTIDDYQGEENDVVILSLVRCNPEGKLGFCAIENRIIVALSRARHALYIIGNSAMFRQDDRWFKVLGRLEALRRVGEGLNLRCANHPEDGGLVSAPADFDRQARHGGCHRACDSLLPCCGHRCPLRCHPFDPEHREVVCTAMCARPRPEGCSHECPWPCSRCSSPAPTDECPTPCEELVEVLLPCGHSQREPCHLVQTPELVAAVECRAPVSVKLACGHERLTTCGAATRRPEELECTHREEVTAACGHVVTVLCKTPQACEQPCARTIERCVHACLRKCGEEHDHAKCQQPCDELLACGHKCRNLCGEAHTSLCDEVCARICAHGFRCTKKCFEACVPCQEPCRWRCRHAACTKRCCELCDRPRCNERCAVVLPCGHRCQGVCGEPCPGCIPCTRRGDTCPLSLERLTDLNVVYELECGHVFDLDMLDQYMSTKQQSGEHVAIQAKCCPTCRKQVHTCPRYGSAVKEQLKLIDAVKREVERRHGHGQISEQERRDVDLAMGGGRSAGGHWFACPNGHPYFIGECGGAMEEATCPECGARVGGGSHRLREDNAFLADFAGQGNAQPAWPGMDL